MGLLSLLKDPNDELLRAALQAACENVQPMANRLGNVPDILTLLISEMGFDVTVGGRVCMVQPVHAKKQQGKGRFIGVAIWVTMQPVPVSISVSGRAIFAMGTPPLDLGDRDFTSAFRAYGFPPDIAAEILDERMRTMLLDRFDQTGRATRRGMTWLRAGQGRVMRFVPVSGSGFFRYRIAVDPAELRAEILETFSIADRLAYAWSRRYAEVATREGPAAAVAWQAARQAETVAYRQGKNRRSLVFVAVVLVVMLLIVGAVFAACVGFTLMHSDINGHPLFQR